MWQKRLILIWVVSLILALQSTVVSAQVGDAFVVKSTSTHLKENVYFLNAVFEIQLPYYITDAIDQGFNLPLLMEVEIFKSRTFWFDEQVVYIKQQYQLNYHPLLDATSVYNANSGRRQYFATLTEAIQHLSVTLDFPLVDKNNLPDDGPYQAQIRLGLDQSQLPIPLKSSSLWQNNWDLKSEWYEWEVTP